MNVKVDIETMTLKIMDCDPFEGAILDMANGKVIEMVLVDASTSEDYIQDLARAEKEMAQSEPQKMSLNLEDVLKAAEQQKSSI